MRALVVDDSKAMRSLLKMILRNVGFEVMEAENGAHALEVLQEKGAVNVTLVDWNMPEMNGYQFLQSARAMPVYDQMQIVMVTTETEISQVKAALHEGANEYIMKPFTKDAVIEKLQILGVVPQTI